MISDNVYIILFKRIYQDLAECVRKRHPTINKDYLAVCLTSSSVFSYFEQLSSSIMAVVHSALLHLGLNDISDEVADDVIAFIKSKYPVYERWVNLSIQHYCDNICQLWDALKEYGIS